MQGQSLQEFSRSENLTDDSVSESLKLVRVKQIPRECGARVKGSVDETCPKLLMTAVMSEANEQIFDLTGG